MNNQQIKTYRPILISNEIAQLLSVDDIIQQVTKFSDREEPIEFAVRSCKLCRLFYKGFPLSVPSSPNCQFTCLEQCPYTRFESKKKSAPGCICFSRVRYGVKGRGVYTAFSEKGRKAALWRYRTALKIKQGKLKVKSFKRKAA